VRARLGGMRRAKSARKRLWVAASVVATALSTWGELLRAGVEIYEYQPKFFHCKVMVVDELWVSVGSTNFDSRSFSVNDEANLNVYDREFAAAQARIFAEDLGRSRRISLEAWENRPLAEKLWEHTVGLFSSQL
jgi:cardiolipin synthase